MNNKKVTLIAWKIIDTDLLTAINEEEFNAQGYLEYMTDYPEEFLDDADIEVTAKIEDVE